MTNTLPSISENFKNAFAPLVETGFAKILRRPQDSHKDALVFVPSDAFFGLGRLASSNTVCNQMVVFTPEEGKWVASIELVAFYGELSKYFKAESDNVARHFVDCHFSDFYTEVAQPTYLNWSGAHSSKIVSRPVANSAYQSPYLATTATNPVDALRALQRAAREYFLQLVSAVKVRTAQN